MRTGKGWSERKRGEGEGASYSIKQRQKTDKNKHKKQKEYVIKKNIIKGCTKFSNAFPQSGVPLKNEKTIQQL